MPVPTDNQIKQSLNQIKRSSNDLITTAQKHQQNLDKLLDQLFQRITD